MPSLIRLVVPVCITLMIGTTSRAQNLETYIANAPFKMPVVTVPQFPDRTFTITDFGAIGNGKTLNTAAFASAIDACAKAGGGRVIVPAGTWLTGPIQFQSNIDLHVEKGAIVQFTSDRTQFPLIKPSPTSKNNYMVMPPVYGYGLENVAITGEGIFDGAGEAWRPLKKSKADNGLWSKFLSSGGVLSKDGKIWWPSREALEGEDYIKTLKKKGGELTEKDFLPARDFLRPKMIVFDNCKNVLYDGVTFRNSPMFVVNPQHCINLTIRNVHVFNEWWAQNGDGMDISACNGVVIYNTSVSAGDDGICMKSSGKSEDAALQNMIIANCTVYRAHGGFVIGSNTDGGMQNIYVTHCNFIGTDIGIRVKSNAGRGGLVKNIYIDNIEMNNIVNEAILFDTYYEDVTAGKEKGDVKTTVQDKVPEFTNFYIKNVNCQGAGAAIKITGLPQMPVHDIYFQDMRIVANTGFTSVDARDIYLKNVNIIAPKPIYNTGNCKNIKIE